MTTVAEVRLWGRRIGAVSLDEGAEVAAFEYDPEFAASRIEVAPLAMPLAPRIYAFPQLPKPAFQGLPGLLADSLPDRFGHALIDAWLASQGRRPESFNAIERLCFVGARGMGALEYAPAVRAGLDRSAKLRVEGLVRLASEVLTARRDLAGSFDVARRHTALTEILRVGTSAGGARAKAVIAWNPATDEVRSGQVTAPPGFTYWLLIFDGVSGNRDKELEDPRGYTVVEYAYSRMAAAAGITMMDCRLLEEGGRRHFMTRRYDRDANGGKVHAQSLGALAHLDYNAAGAHSYEQCFDAIKRLGLPMSDREQQFRRMAFNVVARNQDDHVKNIAFLMDKAGRWSLAPAFDVTYAYNPSGAWTARHQMTINGRREAITRADLRAVAAVAGLKRGRADALLDEVCGAVARWPELAREVDLPAAMRGAIQAALRLRLS